MRAVNKMMGTFAGLLIFSSPAFSHHTFAYSYNTSVIVEVKGEVTEVSWNNPHVSFLIKTSSGEIWQIVSNSANQLARKEISPDTITVGTIKVAGFPARNGDSGLYTSHLMLATGREEVLRPGVLPRWTQPQSELARTAQ